MSEQNKKIVRRMFEQIWNRGNFAVIDERFAGDKVSQGSKHP